MSPPSSRTNPFTIFRTYPDFSPIPRISSPEKDSAAYRPLLSTWFARGLFAWAARSRLFFSWKTALWFMAALFAMFVLFRLIPGVNIFAAAFATLLFGLHPVTADTVNYALQRGVIMGLFGVIMRHADLDLSGRGGSRRRLPLKLKRVPQHGWDEYLRNNFQRLDALYLKIIHAPGGTLSVAGSSRAAVPNRQRLYSRPFCWSIFSCSRRSENSATRFPPPSSASDIGFSSSSSRGSSVSSPGCRQRTTGSPSPGWRCGISSSSLFRCI